MFHIIITYILSIALLLFCGYGLSVYLMPDYLRKYNLLIMPAVGFSLINTISHLFSWLGWGSKEFFWIIILAAGLINFFAYTGGKQKICIKENSFPIFCSFLLFVFCVSPLFKIGSFTPVIGTSGDFITYSLHADYLKENGLHFNFYNEMKPALEQINYGITTGFHFGFDYFHSIVDLILGYKAYKTISLISALFISYYCLAVYFLSESLFNPGKKISGLITLYCAINPFITGISLDGYSHQTIGLDLLIVLFALSILTIKHKNNNLLVLSAFILSSLISTYVEVIPYYIGPMAVYLGILFVRKELDLKTISLLLLKVLPLAFIFNPIGFIRSTKYIFTIYAKGSGNVHDFIPFYEIYGLFHHITNFSPLPHLNPLILFIIMLISFWGIFRLAQSKKDILLCILLPYILFAIIIKYYHQYSYGYFKSLSISLFILLIIFGLGIGEVIKLGRLKKIIVSFVFVLFLLNIFNQVKLLNFFTVNYIKVYSIKRFSDKVLSLAPVDRSIYIANERHTKMLWMTYFLKERAVFINHFTPYPTSRKYPYYKHHIDDEYIILNKNVTKNIYYMSIGEVLEESKEYKILKVNPNIVFYKDNYFNLNNIGSGNQINIDFDDNKMKINDDIYPLNRLENHYQNLPGKAELDGFRRNAAQRLEASACPEPCRRDGRNLIELPLRRTNEKTSPKNKFLQSNSMKRNDSSAYEMSFGFYIPAGGKLEIEDNERSEILKNNDSGVKIIDLSTMPVHIRLKNIGNKEVFLRFIKLERKNHNVFDLYKDKITPYSNAYVVSGWYSLEKDKRWSQGYSLSIFKNTYKESKLILKGTLPIKFFDKKPTIEILVNSHLIDKFTVDSDIIKKEYLLSKETLGEQELGEIEIKVNPTFIPDKINHSGDKRNLGIMIKGINIFGLENLKTNELIDIGESEYNKYLLTGWSHNEISDDKTSFAWAEGKEASLTIFVDKLEGMKMEFRAYPFTFPGNPTQEIHVYVNDKLINKIILKNVGWSLYDTSIPVETLKKGLNTIQFVFSFSESPSNVFKNNGDKRKLSAAFDYIKFMVVSQSKSNK